jgi:hypothetical protein
MSFTAEQIRIYDLETKMEELLRLLDGTGSKNQLGRLHVLLSREVERLQTRITELETKTETVLALIRKAQ